MVEAGTSEIFTQDFRSFFYRWGEASANSEMATKSL